MIWSALILLQLHPMTKILQITFRNPQGRSEAAQQAAQQRAQQIAEWPGLLWKIWIADPPQSLYGGIYCFADEASATAYLHSPIVDRMQTVPGVSDFQAQLFDVNSKLTAIDRGPVPLPASDG